MSAAHIDSARHAFSAFEAHGAKLADARATLARLRLRHREAVSHREKLRGERDRQSALRLLSEAGEAHFNG